jgi:hypothetical protein
MRWNVEIFNTIRAHGPQSVRRLATRTGLSKSSVHRHTQAMAGRNRHPESWWWETAEGRGWLIRLLVAPLCIVGLKRGVGAETISAFCGRLRLEAHVGCSPSALRSVMQVWAQAILETTAAWEYDGIAHGETRPSIGAVDATFLERLVLVCMDLASGDLVVAAVADDRSDDPWYDVGKARLETLGGGVRSLVSARAKALIKLAETGLECLSIPDVFHLMQDLAKRSSPALVSRLRQAQQALTQAQACGTKSQASPLDGPAVQHAHALGEAREAEGQPWQGVRNAYRYHLDNLSLIMYPWRLWALRRQTSQEGARQ